MIKKRFTITCDRCGYTKTVEDSGSFEHFLGKDFCLKCTHEFYDLFEKFMKECDVVCNKDQITFDGVTDG